MRKAFRIMSLLLALALLLSLTPGVFAAKARAAETYTLVASPADGDEVIIYNAGNSVALPATMQGDYYLAGVSITPSGDSITTADSTIVWTVTVNSDGSYSFRNGSSVLSINWNTSSGKTSLSLDGANPKLTLESCNAANSSYYIYSATQTGNYEQIYLEWFARYSDFSAYDTSADRLTETDFGFQFYAKPVDTSVSYDVSFVAPGSTTTLSSDGGYVTAPDCTESYEGYTFVGWAAQEYDEVTADGLGLWYEAGDTIRVTGEASYYALYAGGETESSEGCYYWGYADENGFYGALVGLNYDWDNDVYDAEYPIALGSDATEVDVVSDLGATVDSEEYEFYTNDESIRFEFIPQSDGSFLMVNVENGKYLTAPVADGYATLETSANDYSYWYVDCLSDEEGNEYDYICCAADEDLVLLYDDVYMEFYVFDDSTPIDWILEDYGEYYYPSEYYMICLYVYEEVVSSDALYTTNPEGNATIDPDQPEDPEDPDQPEDPTEGAVTFVTPAASWTVEGEDGIVVAPDCTESYEGYTFECWVTETYEKTDGSDIYEFYYGGEEIEVTGSMTLYALYCYYEIEIGGECYYWAMVEDDDFSGQWALVGFNYDVDIEDYDVESPIALGSDAGGVDVDNDLGASVDAENFEFFTDDDSIRFEFLPQTNGTYLIRNVKTGQYLTAPTSEGYASMSASPSAYSYWYVGYDELYGCEQVISAADENLMLYYDDEYCEFYVFDNTVEIFDGYVASDYYYIYFYAYTSGETEVLYYTTEIDTELPDDPDQPDDPDDPVVPDCQHENTELRGAKEATCTEDGYTGDVYCTDCGEKLYSGAVIKATGHDYEDGVCTVCGEEDPNASEDPEDPEDPDVTTGDCSFDDFSDCKDEWYHEAVDYSVANGLMNGVGNGKFDPNGTMTRAMIVTVLYRAAGSPEVAEPCTFTDVEAGQWYSDAIAWAEDNGVVNGVGEGKFAPMANVTREQIATILWRYSGSPEVEASLDAFADGASVSAYAQDAILWAVAEGIMQGDGKNLTPTANATRAQFACMIMRYLGGSYTCE